MKNILRKKSGKTHFIIASKMKISWVNSNLASERFVY